MQWAMTDRDTLEQYSLLFQRLVTFGMQLKAPKCIFFSFAPYLCRPPLHSPFTQPSLSFSAGIQYSRDSIRVFKRWNKNARQQRKKKG